MKHIFLKLLISITFTLMLSGQEKSLENTPKDILECLVEMGKNTLPNLNVCENKYLNFHFKKDKNTFDFFNKSVSS